MPCLIQVVYAMLVCLEVPFLDDLFMRQGNVPQHLLDSASGGVCFLQSLAGAEHQQQRAFVTGAL